MHSHFPIALLAALAAPAVFAHVSLEEPRAEAGAAYRAVFRVSHGCDAAATTAVTVRWPAGFTSPRPQAKAGWTVLTRAGEATWTAAANAVLPSKERGEFVLAGSLPRQPGPMWFKVNQSCGATALDWAQQPASGTSTEGLKTPAILLNVMAARDLAAWRALPKVESAWARASVPGQQATGAFMRIIAQEATQLVGVSSAAAAVVEVHEMKMEGDVMRMRPAGKLDLPAGQAVDLRPGGYHLMLQDLKQPLLAGTSIPVTLMLRNAAGAESRLELKLPVLVAAPGAAPSASPAGHKH